MAVEEKPIDPDRPIIDPHLHLWEILPAPGSPQAPQRFLFDGLLSTVQDSGHNITHTVFVECGQMYRQGGPDALRSLGETEFVNGVAAMSASGRYGDIRVAHRIVGSVNLLLGAAVRPVLEAHVAAAGERFRGIRMHTSYSEEGLFGFPCNPAHKGVLMRDSFREGASELARMGLSLDAWCLHTQLEEMISLADALPGLTIVLDHIGTPESNGSWADRQTEARTEWAKRICRLAERPNVVVKLGGLGMDISRMLGERMGNADSATLAEEWRPWLETCIEAFGPGRAMFESNFPPDNDGGSYGATWNAFKIIAAGYSDSEKDALFRGTAARIYAIDL